MQGSGASKRSLDGKTVLPPLWGVYYACCIKRGTPHGVIVVVVVVVVAAAVAVLVAAVVFSEDSVRIL